MAGPTTDPESQCTQHHQLDGSMLEGGGQILRNAAALSAILGSSLSIDKIRAGRAKPGLAAQHQKGLELIQAVCSGRLEGCKKGSTEISLEPCQLAAGAFSADTQTAGSCVLLAQAALPCLLFAAPSDSSAQGISTLYLKGGTDAQMAPPIGYFEHVLLPTLARLFGLSVQCEVLKRGFYPQGGGHVRLTAKALPPGAKLRAVDLTERGQVTSAQVVAWQAGSKIPATVAARMAQAAKAALSENQELRGLSGGLDVRQEHLAPDKALGSGCGVACIATTSTGCVFGASAVGERGKPAEAVGREAAEQLLQDLAAGGCVDQWLQDQLVLFLALAEGVSRVACGEPTLHTRTAMVVAERLTGARFAVQRPGRPGAPWGIECHGAGIAAGRTQ